MNLKQIMMHAGQSVALFLFLSGSLWAQTSVWSSKDGAPNTGRLSEAFHTASYSEAFKSNGIQPSWNQGYLTHMTDNKTPGGPNVEMYDRTGKHARDARVWFPNTTEILLLDAIALESGGVLASGHAAMDKGDKSGANFLAKTNATGNVIAFFKTGTFLSLRVCQGADGTVWALGRDLQKSSEKDNSPMLLRRFSFEGGFLQGYLSRDSVELPSHPVSPGGGPQGSYLHCGRAKISLYLNQSDELIEVDVNTQGVERWRMDLSPIPHGKITGFAVTDSGQMYASLYALKTEEQTNTQGLFEILVEQGKTVGFLLPVAGTLNSHREGESGTRNAIWKIWGSDGDSLIIGKQNDPELSWVRVIH